MRKSLIVAGISALFLVSLPTSFAAGAPPAKNASGTIVIVFKDGHRQAFNLSEIERVEFPSGSTAAADVPSNGQAGAPRGRFFGTWQVGDGNGGTFDITLKENGSAHRTLNDIDGHWAYVNGEAQITWNDGAMDAIRKVGAKFQKFAYAAGKSFTDTPDNVTAAHNTSPRPI